MNKQKFEIIISFDSGEQIKYEDLSQSLVIQDSFNSQNILNPDLRILPNGEHYNNVITINTSPDNITATEYNNFRFFCKKILRILDKTENNKISNIVIKDNNEEIFYNILKNEIVGIDIEGTTNYTVENKKIFLFRLLVFLKDNGV